MKTGAIILGAGKGTRMKSKQPKVLHKILGKPLIAYVREEVSPLITEKAVVVIGHGGELVKEYFKEEVAYGVQEEQLGTGDAVKCGLVACGDEEQVFVLCGDTPLLTEESLRAMKTIHEMGGMSGTVLTAMVDDSTGYGRIVKDEGGRFVKIVEEKDASEAEKTICEINSGTYIFNRKDLEDALGKLKTDNAQGEYYLTDVLSIFKREGKGVGVYTLPDEEEVMGINNRVQLFNAGKLMQMRINEEHMLNGVTLEDPATTYIGSSVRIGQDVVIGANVHLEGKVSIGEDTVIGPNTTIIDSEIGEGNMITHSIILESKMGNGCNIGPFAYLRPLSELADRVKIGDFVELKKTQVKNGSKIPHHSYIGDALVGEKVNVGAGTITCNYDGKNKFQTILEDGSFIGSNTNLVAPVRIGKNSYVGAGSTIVFDVPDDSLGLARGRQNNKENWTKNKKG